MMSSLINFYGTNMRNVILFLKEYHVAPSL